MDTIIKASDAAELLSLVPALAGFTPARSLVLLPFHGTRAPGVLRMDLPPGDDVEDYVDAVLELLVQVRGCDAIAVVVYTDEDATHTRDGLVLPHAVLLEHLLGCAHDEGFHIVEGLCVLPSGWSDYLEPEPALHPLDEIPPVPGLPGVDVAADQHTGASLPQADLAARQRVGLALRDLDAVLERLRCDGARLGHDENPQAIGAAVMLDDIPSFAETLLEGRTTRRRSHAPLCCGACTAPRCATPCWCNGPATRGPACVPSTRSWGTRGVERRPRPRSATSSSVVPATRIRHACAGRWKRCDTPLRARRASCDPAPWPPPHGCPGRWAGRRMRTRTCGCRSRSTPSTA
ncbi:DUF4192 domain-containing protein [Microbacterium sp. KUDC0406]|uniref:DUF4192 family protein n=1 Tax=Microbacterium sp. KUDC0406 TaxID=2909588 RepID=UPI001F276680|nr:DUF4192 family protein [Microbacterium sp. KUDC0406]UJP09113.1 DUF4192 domain-containing protein [Microbacterium sp. KUDC0406]